MRIFLLGFCLATFPFGSAQADWPAWRGPDSNTVAPSRGYPVDIGPEKNVVWSVDLPGQGTSTPVVWRDAIYVTAVDDVHNLVCSYDLQGKQRWRKELGTKTPAKHRSASGGNPSPVVDADHVIVYFKSGELTCFSHDGDTLWDVNLQQEYGKDTLWWDLGTSPVLSSRGVVVAVMQDGDSFLLTLDIDSGELIWKQPRQYTRPRESDQAYTTPQVLEVEGKETIVTWGADHLTGHDAQTGALLWDHDGFNPADEVNWRVIASATLADNVAYIPFGRSKHFAAVQLGTHEEPWLWQKDGVGSDVTCPVVRDGKVYILGDQGEVTCLDAKTGDEVWSDALPRSRRAKFFSTPTLAGDNLYCIRENGECFVVDIADGFKLVAENDLGEDTVATPVPLEEGLLIRTRTKLYLFGAGS